jgi:phage protein D
MISMISNALSGLTVAATPPQEPQLAISLGNQPLDDKIAACVLDLSVDRTIDQADHLSLRLATWNPDTDKTLWIDDGRFAPGTGLAVKLGYGQSLAPVFDGEIVELGLELRGGEPPVMTIEAYNRLHRLGRGRPAPATPPEPNSTYGDLVAKIAKRYGLTPDVRGSDADKQNDAVNQQNESDLQFIAELAGEIGYEFFVDGKKLVFRKQVAATTAAVTLTTSDLLELSAHADAAGQIGAIEGSAFDHERNEAIPYKASNPDSFDKAYGNVEISLAHPLAVDRKEQLKARIDAELVRIRNSYLSVTATCFGRTDLKVGMMIAIQGIARRFDGSYSVTAVAHSFSQSAGFRTRLTLKGMKGSRR